MSKREPFVIHPGAGGLEGRARLFRDQSRGAHNERIYQWLKERATAEGTGNPPKVTEIIIPEADLIWTAEELASFNGYTDNQILPKAGPPNDYPVSGVLGAGTGWKLDYRNTGGGTGQWKDSTDPTFDLPPGIGDASYVRMDQISGNADAWSDNDKNIGAIVNRDGVTSQNWCWFIVMRRWNRGPAAGGSTAFSDVVGGRKTTVPFRGYGFFTRSGGGLTTWTTNLWWVVGSTAFGVSGSQNNPIGNTNADWVVYAVQSEDSGKFVHGTSRSYQDLDIHFRTGDIQYKLASDSLPLQFSNDGSNNGGGDTDFAERRFFNRALTPSEFNLAMADLLVKYGLSPL